MLGRTVSSSVEQRSEALVAAGGQQRRVGGPRSAPRAATWSRLAGAGALHHVSQVGQLDRPFGLLWGNVADALAVSVEGVVPRRLPQPVVADLLQGQAVPDPLLIDVVEDHLFAGA